MESCLTARQSGNPDYDMTNEPALPRFQSVPRNLSLADKVTQQLTEMIVSGDLTPGERLPSERELGNQFDVSRTVIREAVRSLVARGLVKVTSGRGVEVVAANSDDVATSMRLFVRGRSGLDYGQVHEVRTAIEVQVAGLAAARASADDLERLRSLCDKYQESLTSGDTDAASQFDFQFHQELARSAGNDLLVAMLDSISDILMEVRQRAMVRPTVAESGLKAHRWILECIAARDPQAARGAMERHLGEAEQAWRVGLVAPAKPRRRRA